MRIVSLSKNPAKVTITDEPLLKNFYPLSSLEPLSGY
jgi:hypothetical protein